MTPDPNKRSTIAELRKLLESMGSKAFQAKLASVTEKEQLAVADAVCREMAADIAAKLKEMSPEHLLLTVSMATLRAYALAFSRQAVPMGPEMLGFHGETSLAEIAFKCLAIECLRIWVVGAVDTDGAQSN